ncbi:MAG: Gfo/Idh/MocA family oxidoreductase [Pseudomonadota bacterium]
MTSPAIAVFGAGLVGARHVAQTATQARLAAIIDPAPAARDLAAQHDVPWFADPAAYLNTQTPDGVVISTPNALHADHAVVCLTRRIPCLIEKPIAATVAAATRIVDASAQHETLVLVGHHRRHNPIIARAKAIIDTGTLGDITAVTGQFWLYKPDDYFDAPWRTQPGGGPTMINCIHDIDLMRHLVGEITDLHALRSHARRGHAVEDTAALSMRFANGALGSFSISDTVAAPWSWEMTSAENPVYPHVAESCYRIGGTHGSLSLPDLTLWRHDGPRSWWEPISGGVQTVTSADAFARQFRHFLDVIAGADPAVPATEGRASLAATLLVHADAT